MTTLQDFAFNLTKASGEPMKGAAIAYAVLVARALLPKDNPARIDPKEARMAVEELDKVSKKALAGGAVEAHGGKDAIGSEATIAAVLSTFPRVHTCLEKLFGQARGAVAPLPGQEDGERGFWEMVLNEADHTTMIAYVMAALKTNQSPYTGEPWDGTWKGLRNFVGFKPAKKKTALAVLAAALRKARKDVEEDNMSFREAVFGEDDNGPCGIASFLTDCPDGVLADVIAEANKLLTARRPVVVVHDLEQIAA